METRALFFPKSLKATLLVAMLLMAGAARAQFAVGMRPSIYNYSSFDNRLRAEISALTGTMPNGTRFEFDFGWGHRDVYTVLSTTLVDGQLVSQIASHEQLWGSFTALYQWRHKILWHLYYYAGVGATAVVSDEAFEMLGANVQLGLELQLKIPLQLTLDYRPMLDVLDGMVYHSTVGLGVRYAFRPPEPEPEPKFFSKWKKKWLE